MTSLSNLYQKCLHFNKKNVWPMIFLLRRHYYINTQEVMTVLTGFIIKRCQSYISDVITIILPVNQWVRTDMFRLASHCMRMYSFCCWHFLTKNRQVCWCQKQCYSHINNHIPTKNMDTYCLMLLFTINISCLFQ